MDYLVLSEIYIKPKDRHEFEKETKIHKKHCDPYPNERVIRQSQQRKKL
jgi:hypothetical protein